jgi:hypothetical protein
MSGLPDRFGERLPERRTGGVPWGWVGVGAVAGIAAMLVVQTVLAIVFGLVRWAVIGVAVAAIGWLVIVGPPDRKRRQ